MGRKKTFIRLTRDEETEPNKAEKLIAFYRQNPVIAAEELLNIKLVWYQRMCLNSMWFKQFTLLLLSRRTGKSWLLAVFSILYCMLYPGTKIGIMGPVYRQTIYVFDYIEEIWAISPYFRACAPDGIKKGMMNSIVKIANGYIEGLPVGDGKKIRGRGYNIGCIDEYAFHEESIIKTVIRPMLAVRRKDRPNKLITSSTAYYTWNHLYKHFLFYHLMQQEQPELYAVHEFDYRDAINIPDAPFIMDINYINEQKSDMTEEEFNMEYLCQFPIEVSGFFPVTLIERCTPKRNDGVPIELSGYEGDKPKSIYVMGVDAAYVAGGDNFVVSILKIEENIRKLIKVTAINGPSFQQMVNTIRSNLEDFPIVRIHMDNDGYGKSLKELLGEKWINKNGDSRPPIIDMEEDTVKEGLKTLRMVNFTRPLIYDIYSKLKADMQHERFKFPITVRKDPNTNLEKASYDILKTKQELMVLQAVGQGNTFVFEVPEKFKKDRATALALANQAADEYLKEMEVKANVGTLGQGFWTEIPIQSSSVI